jgi:hypothetical protein
LELVLPGEIEMTSSQQDAGRRCLNGLTITLCLMLSGCVTTESFLPRHMEKPPMGRVCHVAASWKKDVIFAPDPTRGGTPQPGLAGRIYCFDEKLAYRRMSLRSTYASASSRKRERRSTTKVTRWSWHRLP